MVVDPSLRDQLQADSARSLVATGMGMEVGKDPGQGPGPERSGLIVGIGAAAGGIDALRSFFSRVPPDINMAFVVVQHLDPSYDSNLATIIGGYTILPVQLARDGMTVCPNHVYVVPPNAVLTISHGILRVATSAAPLARRVLVNTFLVSLAEDQGESAVGIILSGFGSDGALGAAAIKEHGGLTFSQAESEHQAKAGMPRSATAAGFVDHVLAVEDMAKALVEYRHYRAVCDIHKGQDGIREDLPAYLATICAVLHNRLGRDFSNYKAGSLMRRIQRRMHVLQTEDIPHYIEQLRTLPQEADLLFREVLLSVTRFFRDREAFEGLESTVIPALLADPHSTTPVRVWVAGCATGEEAYSVAILLKEALARLKSCRMVQVFATDLDDHAITAARAGLYPGAIASDMSPERLERNFLKEDGSYRITKEVREMCLFSVHDLVKDPPFSHIDLVCCRNLMIHFDPQLQQRVLATFHYALRPGHFLFLGLSEGTASQVGLFVPFDKHQSLYTRQDMPPAAPPLPTAGALDLPLVPTPPATNDIDQHTARVIARYVPAFLVVNRQHDVLRFSGQTAKFLEPAPGIASLNLFALLHADLRAAVLTALKQSAATGERVVQMGLPVEIGEHYEMVNLIVEPLPGAGKGGLSVIAFQEAGRRVAPLRHEPLPSAPGGDDHATTSAREALDLRQRLHGMSEQLAAANQELQSSNREYRSFTEELQTINAELNHRNDSLVRSNGDLANLFDSTSIATLFLDRDMRIRRFTPRLLDIFNIRQDDERRPISDIVTHLTRDGLGQDVHQVLLTLIPREREVAIGGVSYLMQVRPHRDLNGATNGVVITFVDLSERKKHEHARSRLAAIVESSQDAIIAHSLDGIVTSWNDGAHRLFGISAIEAVGLPMLLVVRNALPWDWQDMLERLRKGEQLPMFECSGTAANGKAVEVSVTVSPIWEGYGRIAGVSVVARDISARRAAELKAALLLSELDHRVKNILAIVSAVVSQTLKANPASPDAFAAEVSGRIQAIAKAHSLLTQAGTGEVSLRAILQTELAPYDGGAGNVSVIGEDVALTPKAGLSLAMAVHELASNAAKYGALSTDQGRLGIAVTVGPVEGTPALTLAWTETGGPPVAPPTRRGFGTTLIERALAHEMDAAVTREFPETGLLCTIAIPLTGDVGRARRPGEVGS